MLYTTLIYEKCSEALWHIEQQHVIWGSQKPHKLNNMVKKLRSQIQHHTHWALLFSKQSFKAICTPLVLRQLVHPYKNESEWLAYYIHSVLNSTPRSWILHMHTVCKHFEFAAKSIHFAFSFASMYFLPRLSYS